MKDTAKKKRIVFAMITAVLLAIEVFIALYFKSGFIRYSVGDMIVTLLLYTFVRIFIPEKIKLMPLYIFIFACLVEYLQSINIVGILGLENSAFFRTLIGTVFSWEDILCYSVGCIVAGVYEVIKLKRKAR